MNLIFAIVVTLALAFNANQTTEELFKTLNLPEGFKIELWASNLTHARSIARAPTAGSPIFVGSFDFTGIGGNNMSSSVYAISVGSDNRPQSVAAVTTLQTPNGVAFDGTNLYIALNDKLVAVKNITQNLTASYTPTIVSSAFFNASAVNPDALWHGWHYARVKGDRLYVSVGSPCNTPNDPSQANATCKCYLPGGGCSYPAGLWQYIGTIISGKLPDFTDIKVEAHGIRNSVGIDFVGDDLWFTDNGRDNMDPDHDNRPPDELNRLAPNASNNNYGFPFCYGNDTFDPEFNHANNCLAYVPTVQNLDPHVAAVGLRFYRNALKKSFPSQYHNGVFIAEHGSWDRTPPSGYRISFVNFDENMTAISYSTFVDGWLQYKAGDNAMSPPTWGRLADVEFLDDGSMIVTNEMRGEIYRIYYDPIQTNWLLILGIAAGVIVVAVIVIAIIVRRRKSTYTQL